MSSRPLSTISKASLFSACTLLLLAAACTSKQPTCTPGTRDRKLLSIDSLATSLSWPKDLQVTGFAGPALTPSPACLAVAPTGEVYVGVDMIGSLGKTPGKGRIVRLVDCDNDGIMDSHTEYAVVDDPRGIISMGDKLFVLHTVFANDSVPTGMDLVVFEDKNKDGVADGPSVPLVRHMSNPTFLQSRGTDHATNGIRMGIDGWIYIAVGDFGFHDAVGTDGRKLTMLGGGIVRVRPDGTEMEIFTHGLRNIYDVAIDPYMNVFTRDNTNDGDGWNIRFNHQLQSGEYGYPTLFKHFTEEIIPALVDLGGGSGTGALFMDDPAWPDKYNHVPMTADWGRSELYIHHLTNDGGTYKQEQELFLKIPQITDLDVDGSGRLYLSAWDGAGYSGDSTRGFVARVVPANWVYKPFPDLKASSADELAALLSDPRALTSLSAQQELLARGLDAAAQAAWPVAQDKTLPLYGRVAGLFTYAQAAGKEGIKNLIQLSSDTSIKEYCLRALTDRKPLTTEVPIEPFLNGLKDPSPRVQLAAIIGLGRLGRPEASTALLKVPIPASFAPVPPGQEGPHATPNSAIVPAHLAVRALVSLNAIDACVAAIGTENSKMALWALRYMHDPKAVNGLIAAYKASSYSDLPASPDLAVKASQDKALKEDILSTLARLYDIEAPYDGTTWWNTRPDTHGPYYKPVTWAGSDTIRALLMEEWKKPNGPGKEFFATLNGKLRMGITPFGGEDKRVVEKEARIDLQKIRNVKGEIGNSSIENIMLALAKIKGDPSVGKVLFARQGCIACHSLKKTDIMKGPFMGQIGSIMNRQQIAESILKPNASIAQGFASVQLTTKDGGSLLGFVTEESAEKITLRDISGTVHNVNTKDIKTRKILDTSIMPTGLANALSYEEFASLVSFLSQQK